MKTCTRCLQELPDNHFHKRTFKSGRVGLQPKCKKCSTEVRRGYYKPHEKTRQKLKITEEQYQELMSAEVCEICGQDFEGKKCIDHCHTMEKVRGVLCNKCNTALGLVGDNVNTLSLMIDYINRSQVLSGQQECC